VFGECSSECVGAEVWCRNVVRIAAVVRRIILNWLATEIYSEYLYFIGLKITVFLDVAPCGLVETENVEHCVAYMMIVTIFFFYILLNFYITFVSLL
jgi:hypothetical protein